MPSERDDTTDPETEPMTDQRDTPGDDAVPDTVMQGTGLHKEESIEYGERGDLVRQDVEKDVNPDTGTIEKQITAVSFCECGDTIVDPEDAYRCYSCEDLMCTSCRFNITRRNYCPDCVQHKFGVRRKVYYALHLIDLGLHTPEELVDGRTVDTDLANIQIDNTADTLLDRGLVRTGHVQGSAATIGDDDPLTADGRQVLGIGERLFGDDPDVEQFKTDAQRLKATRHDR